MKITNSCPGGWFSVFGLVFVFSLLPLGCGKQTPVGTVSKAPASDPKTVDKSGDGKANVPESPSGSRAGSGGLADPAVPATGIPPNQEYFPTGGGQNEDVAPAAPVGQNKDYRINRTIIADVVAIDQPFMINRLGASQPAGMIFVLKDDITYLSGTKEPFVKLDPEQDLGPRNFKRNFKLRDGKRPRPVVLRMNVGDMLQINFENWLEPLSSLGSISAATQANPVKITTASTKGMADGAQVQIGGVLGMTQINGQFTIANVTRTTFDLKDTNGTSFKPYTGGGAWTFMESETQQLSPLNFFVQNTRYAGIHVAGLELVGNINSDSSWVGENTENSLAEPWLAAVGGIPNPKSYKTYELFARETGTFLLSSPADTTVHQLNAGLFGAVNVQPTGAEWYRSQTTRNEMMAATLEAIELRGMSIREPDKAFAESVEPYAPGTQESLQPKSLVIAAHGPQAQEKRNILLDADGRVRCDLGQPLINYHSVFKREDLQNCPGSALDKPVLSMLNAVATQPVTEVKLGEGDYQTEVLQLDNGFISSYLRDLFRIKAGIILHRRATIARAANANPYSWVVTNPLTEPAFPSEPGKTYLLQGVLIEGIHGVTIAQCEMRLVHSDLTAIITGPNAGIFPYSQDSPDFYSNPASPDRRQPYREFTIIYHQGGNVVQAFPQWSNNNLFRMINAGLDQFGINYGFAAIGPEIVANRLGVGPMGNSQQGQAGAGGGEANQSNDSVDLKYEEFFLSSWCVGDPAMIVDVPSNAQNQFVSNPEQGMEIAGAVQSNPIQWDSFKRKPAPNDLEFDLAAQGPGGDRPQKAFYPDDPSNVYHSYMRDHTKMRVLHAGPGPAHVHHLHAHQWLHAPNSPDATYLDSQLILPGSAYTLEITYNGSGNRNQTVGDSIFHCHFYPHFAKGMWSLWRVHDTFESGTWLDNQGPGMGICVTRVDGEGQPVSPVQADGTPNPAYKDAKPVPNRALPDGEIVSGTPTPALIPLPTLGMAPMPAEVQVTDLDPWYEKGVGMGRRIEVLKDKDGKLKNPGYPFFIPGIGGHRPPHPPMDMAWKELKDGKEEDQKARWTNKKIEDELGLDPSEAAVKEGEVQYLDGGLPRHLVLGGDVVAQYQTRWDFSKDFVKKVGDDHVGRLYAFQLPENGTPIEQVAMKTHATRTHETRLPENAKAGNFILNGLPATHGAPYADPSVTEDGNSSGVARRYQAAVIQTDVVLNKKGWHYPQQRFITLWEDVADTISNTRPPEPFFIRTATNDATQLWHTNLVPNYYELDDFQVRTPTDVIGQHIHLVKFDVTASDGAANGWNYEDGTFGPTEVQDRIHAITNAGGLYEFDPEKGFVNTNSAPRKVAIWKNEFAYPPRKTASGQIIGDPENGLFGPAPPGQNWDGAMTTIQRWAIDPLLNWQGHDRTLRTVFTHDHFGPSTHQQVGLYAGVLVEPAGSNWYLPDGQPMNTRADGGPTSWQAIIVSADAQDTHREYAIEFQDMQLAYTADSTIGPLGSNVHFQPKLLGDARNILAQKIGAEAAGKYVGNDKAPAAFYVGQSGVTEQQNIGDRLGDLVNIADPAKPQQDREQAAKNWVALFGNYGIVIDTSIEVTMLYPGDVIDNKSTQINAQFLIQQPAPGINAGDYYIVQATNPQIVAPSVILAPQALSVFTPVIAPGFAEPEYAVNPNWGSDIKQGGKFFGNIGTPTGKPQGSTVSEFHFGNGAPYPSLVSTRANGTYSMNYRNEPVELRYEAGVKSGVTKWNDLAYVYTSPQGDFNDPMAKQPKPGEAIGPVPDYKYPPNLIPANTPGGPQNTDPYTPLIRGYAGDDIQIRTLVGAHLQPHAFTIHGVKWLAQPSYMNSGFRNVQGMGLSEHFEMRFKMPAARRGYPIKTPDGSEIPDGADYFYAGSADAVGLSNGVWGIMRSYDRLVGEPAKPKDISKPVGYDNPLDVPKPWETDYLHPLISNSKFVDGKLQPVPHDAIDFAKQFELAQQLGRPTREFVVQAINRKIDFNPRETTADANGPFQGPDGIVFLLTDEKQNGKPVTPKFMAAAGDEPLVLRAAAGEWIKVTLHSDFIPTDKQIAFPYGNSVPFNGLTDHSDLQPVGMNVSGQVGLHPQLVEFDVTTSNGINVGFNPDSTAAAKNDKIYYWYAGEFKRNTEGLIKFRKEEFLDQNKATQTVKQVETIPIEFGATNLVGADLILQTSFGLVGALVIEPKGSTWLIDGAKEGKPRPTMATVIPKDGPAFRECVLVMQNIVAGELAQINGVNGQPLGNLKTILTPGREDLPNQTGRRQQGFGAVNYRTESFAARGVNAVPDEGFSKVFSNLQVNPAGDPETPVFTAPAGMPTRFRVIMPGTTTANSTAQPLVFAIHGHGWQDEPYINDSTEIGHNDMAQFIGSQKVTVTQKYDILLDSAGGPFAVPGDYLYQGFNQEQKIGIWGIFRVLPATK